MNTVNLHALISRAVANGAMDKLLLGSDSYAYLPPRSPALGTTDLAEILQFLNEYCPLDLREKARKSLVDALEVLALKYEGLEAVASCIVVEALNQSRLGPTLDLPIVAFAEKLRSSIERYANRLESDKSGSGAVWPDGKLGELRRLSTISMELGGPSFCSR